jgi:hypothetical protein
MEVFEIVIALLLGGAILAASLYVYPPCASPSDDFDRAVRKQAGDLGVGDFTLTHTPGSEAVPASPFGIARMQIHGRGEFGDVAWLLRRIAALGQSRVLDFETVHLRAGSGRDVALDGTVAIGCHDRDSKALEAVFPRGGTPAEMELAMYRERSQKLRAAAAAAKKLEERMQPRRLVDALLVLADVWGRSAVGVSDLRYAAPALTLQGVVLGASAKAAVEGSLREPRFALARLDWSPAGDCQAFTRARSWSATRKSSPPRTFAWPASPGRTAPGRRSSACSVHRSSSSSPLPAQTCSMLRTTRGRDVVVALP